MTLGELLKHVPGRCDREAMTVEIRGVSTDSRDTEAGFLFFAVKGDKQDGAQFVPDAVRRGAVAVASDRALDLPDGIFLVVFEDVRAASAKAARRLFGRPDEELELYGVTGTNGKTTTTHLLASILESGGRRCAVMGTLGLKRAQGDLDVSLDKDRSRARPGTTPGPDSFYRQLKDLVSAGYDACTVEVSSHGLDQRRTHDCHWRAAIFTNLSPEHLDYHGDMRTYFDAKKILFQELRAEAAAVVNIDDPYGAELAGSLDRRVSTYGLTSAADYCGRVASMDEEGMRLEIKEPGESGGRFETRTSLIGRVNAYNILAAAAAARESGIGVEQVAEGLENLKNVPGRYQQIETGKDYSVFVDYAHTEQALQILLEDLRALSGGRLILVFGCGGDRDREKRPAMGRAAARLADVVFVTSDNPRSEDPRAIANEVLKGALSEDAVRAIVTVELDRMKAVEQALAMARPSDVVVLAGKGHEHGQEIGSRVIPYSDPEAVRELLGLSDPGEIGSS